MRRSLLLVLGLAFGCIIFDLCGARNHFLHAQQTSYYEGKTVRLVVGSSPGGLRPLGENIGTLSAEIFERKSRLRRSEHARGWIIDGCKLRVRRSEARRFDSRNAQPAGLHGAARWRERSEVRHSEVQLDRIAGPHPTILSFGPTVHLRRSMMSSKQRRRRNVEVREERARA